MKENQELIDNEELKKFLLREYEKATKGELTRDCRHGNCNACGICPTLDTDMDTIK